jgi:hypothetical protein
MASHAHLRGHTITEAGWDGLESYISDSPAFAVIDDFFTDYTAAEISKCHGDELVDPLFETVDFLAELSAPNGKISMQTRDMTMGASSMEVHTDPELGDVYLANFSVEGNPFYTVYPNVTNKLFKYRGTDGDTFLTAANPRRPHKIQIMSKQLVVLSGDATKTDYLIDGSITTTTIPHEVTVSEGDTRTLLIVHGVAALEHSSIEDTSLVLTAA